MTITSKDNEYTNNSTGTNSIEIYKLLHGEGELSLDSMFTQLETSDPRAAAATEVGTKWIAETFLSEHPITLATLRMRAGFSQRELGQMLGVSQPQIAKWEKEDTPNMHIETVKNLAKALSVAPAELFEIIAGINKDTKNEHQL